MKYITLVAVFISAINFSFGQGLINDIMNVETVNLDLNEVHEKLITKYKLTLEKEKTSMDNDIASLDKKYKEEVKKYVDDFTQKLKDGEEKVVASVKKVTVSRVNSLTMTHRTEKKNIVQNFLNKMQVANRSLPKFLREDAATEVESISTMHLETLTSDYAAHLETIKAFEEQQHLVVTEGAYEPLP